MTSIGFNNGILNAGSYEAGFCARIGISLSAGVFKVLGANGLDLSTTNPGFVTLPDNSNPGRMISYTVTANQTFSDNSSGGSTIAGNLFGIVSGVNWGNDMPIYLYAVSDSTQTAISFMISRVPNRSSAPVAGNIGKTGSAVASTQGSFFALGNPTVANYASMPCLCLGSFRMQKVAGATNDWTVSSLSITDGIGLFQELQVFTFPSGQFSATAGKYFLPNGGTAPQWSSQVSIYFINRYGKLTYFNTLSTISVSGVGAVTLIGVIPYAYKLNSLQDNMSLFLNGAGTLYTNIWTANPGTAISNITFIIDQGTTNVALQNQDCTLSAAMTLRFGYYCDIA